MTPLIRLTIAWLAGILLASQLHPSHAALAVAVGVCLTLRFKLRSQAWQPPTPRLARLAAYLGPVLGLTLAALLGAWRHQLAEPHLDRGHIALRNDHGETVFKGRIADEPDVRDKRTDYRVAVEAALPAGVTSKKGIRRSESDSEDWRPAHGLVLVQAARFPPHAYGETVLVTASLEAAPEIEGFDYRAYLAHQGIFSIAQRPRVRTLATGGGNPVRAALIGVKDRARRVLWAALPEPESALATGILLGDERGIPERVDAAFRTTNTTHVIAISGSNISLLVTTLMVTLGRLFGRRRAVPVILTVVALYTVLVGADAAVVRAAVMGSLMVLAGPLGRPSHAANALFAAALAMTLYNPFTLWDLGFQLSFAATLGLILFASRFSAGLETWLGRRVATERAKALVGLLNEALLVTLAAQLTTWPIIAYQTGQVSLVGLAANLFILPAQPLVMLLGAATTAGGLAWGPAGRALGMLAWLPIAYTIRVVELFAKVPHAAVHWPMPGWAVVAYFVGLGFVAVPNVRGRMRDVRAAWRSTSGEVAVSSGGAGLDEQVDPAAEPEIPESLGVQRPLDLTALHDSADPTVFHAPPGPIDFRRPLGPGTLRNPAITTGLSAPLELTAPFSPSPRGPTSPLDRDSPVPPLPPPLPLPIDFDLDPSASRSHLPHRFTSPRALLALTCACLLAWTAALTQPDAFLHVYALDIGQGDAILVVTPNGRRMLVDGGPGNSAVLDGLGRHMPPWDRRLDLVVLSHPDADHVGGLASVLDRYAVRYILDPKLEGGSPEAAAWSAGVAKERQAGAEVVRAEAGQRVVLDAAAGVWAEVLWPPSVRLEGTDSKANNNAVVLRITYGRSALLLTADVEAPAEEALLRMGVRLKSDVLKVGHHGSDTSTTPPFLAAVAPSLAVISVGEGNRFGHPTEATLARLAAILVKRTDLDGTVDVISDGESVWVR